MYRSILDKRGEFKLVASLAPSSAHIANAQKLHAAVYLKRGFIRPGDIGEDGRLSLDADPHQAHATYFVVTTGGQDERARAVARQIRVNGQLGFGSFPILGQAKIKTRELAAIKKYRPQECVEISALAKEHGESSLAPLLLYREMLRESLRRGDKLWLMACDVNLFRRLKLLFGKSIRQIGEPTDYYGGVVIPAALNIELVIPSMLDVLQKSSPFHRAVRWRVMRFMLTAYAPEHINRRYEPILRAKRII